MPSFPHDQSAFFSFENPTFASFVEKFFALELLSEGEKDLTAEIFVEKNATKKAFVVAKSAGILAGKAEVCFFLEKFFPELTTIWHKKDGESVFPHEKILEITGNARQMLHAERILLNVLSRMSGIATTTQQFVHKIFPTHIAATRKTHWGFLDKKAVCIGGGLSHRIGLFDAVLVKENHLLSSDFGIKILSQIDTKTEKDFENAKFVEVEVENAEEFFEIFHIFQNENLQKMQKVIMFDDFLPEEIVEILAHIDTKTAKNNNIFFEASGGICLENAEKYAKTGVDVLSSGNLTNAVFPVDFSLRMEK